ncbi:EAL domain-containing protein [Pseudomonas sp. MSSRFD41]|uniref:EAL domain-containing protein n=1 Tax=Pseudomonas sp. MSSRFD41 TaxID=1310370 RepID=UPI00163A004A|nr:EAL domain-containing protein [Pseudomonas sp. MSSRFD41]MBC2656930.1 EAL domain-containing protein [Pseudomonas sp. MSSRFD41]
MPLSAKGPLQHSTRIVWTLLAILLPIVLGAVILYLQAQRTLLHNSLEIAEEAIGQFDQMLDHSDSAARALLPLAGQKCDAARQLALREQVTRRPLVRSTNLVWRDNNYCSSYLGNYAAVLDPRDYVEGRLRLMDGNHITPETPLLVYRLSDGDGAALAAINGYHPTNTLRMLSRFAQLQLQVGRHWLSSDGQVREGNAPLAAVASQQLTSSRYPYSINAGFAQGSVWRYMKSQYPVLFSLLVFLGAAAGGLAHWLQQRAVSPRHELQRALVAREFIPYFQPIVRGDGLHWAGIEVLMRWQHPREGLVRPDLFIPFAEHTGLIVPMTRSLLRQTREVLAPWAGNFTDGFHIAINITARHCQDLQLLEDCREFLAAFEPGKVVLVLELTERELIEPTAVTQQLFAELRELGVMIAIDDFGTGHSSLGYLRTFNVDYLKIDKSFVAMIGADALSLHILDSIIELSLKLDLSIVAEGIETAEQRDYLTAKGVHLLQGYLFGKPMPSSEFVTAIARH